MKAGKMQMEYNDVDFVDYICHHIRTTNFIFRYLSVPPFTGTDPTCLNLASNTELNANC